MPIILEAEGEEKGKKGGSVNPQTSSRMLAVPTECMYGRDLH